MPDTPSDLDANLVKAFARALNATQSTLAKHKADRERSGVAANGYTIFDRVGIWCTHLRTQLWDLGEASRAHGLVVKTLCDKNMWDDVAVPVRYFEKWKKTDTNYGSTSYFK